MKLLLCTECSDIFNLDLHVKTCTCGKARGVYTDELNAVYMGGIPIGFSNSTLLDALRNQPEAGLGKPFTAFVIPVQCPTFKELQSWSFDESPPTSTPPSSSSARTKTSRTKSKRSAKRR